MTLPALEPIVLSTHLLAIPKLDKAKFISSYLQEQTAHAKAHASQGRALVSSWEHEDPGSVMAPPEVGQGEKGRLSSKLLVVDYGFGTPVLKPRVVMRTIPDIERPLAKKDEAAIISKDSYISRQAEGSNQERHTKRKRTMSGSPQKASKLKPQSGKARARRKQDSGSDPESERAKRLKERRDKKRAKRAITKPATDVDTRSETLSERSIAKKVTTKRVPKTKIPAGLALMHGFSATNVGSGRLTVKPSLSVGVFNKGKASAKTSKRPAKVEGRVKSAFTEKDFLSKTRRKSENKREEQKRVLSSSPSAGRDTVTTNSEEGLETNERVKAAKQIRKSRKLRDSNSGQDAVSHVATKQTKVSLTMEDVHVDSPGKIRRLGTRPDSIIWDIELDDASLPSERIPSTSEKRSVLLNTCRVAWGNPSNRAPGIGLAAPQHQLPRRGSFGVEYIDITAAQRPSSSIGPSESASQYGQRVLRRDVPLQEASSKYFAVPMIREELPVASPDAAACLQNTLEQSTTRTMTSTDDGVPDDNVDNTLNLTLHKAVSPLKPLSAMYKAAETLDYQIIDSSTNSLDYLPEVDLQDYKYSDEGVHLWPLEDFGWSDGLFRVMTHENGDIYTDELSCGISEKNNAHLSFHEWHELESSFHHQLHGGATEYEAEGEDQAAGNGACEEDNSLGNDVDDGNRAWEYTSAYGPDAFESDCDRPGNNFFSLHDCAVSDPARGGGGRVTYDCESLENEPEEIYQLPTSGDLELCTNEDDGSVDYVARFAQGRALLLGYSEQGVHPMGLFPGLSRRREVSLVEAEVAKRLKNHWLPQRL